MQDHPIPQKGGITLFHVFVVCLSMMATLAAWQFSKGQMETRIDQRFAESRDRTLALIHDRMTKYEDALWAGVAAVESHDGDISYPDWHSYAQKLRIDGRYPDINGIGVIHFHTRDTLPEYLSEQQRSRPDFAVFPAHTEDIFMPITYIEPEAGNAAAIGLDIAHEQNRRTAALLSRDTGKAQITGPIVLVQDTAQTPGFLFYALLYTGAPHSTLDQCRAQIAGAVYAPFVVHKLVRGLLAKEMRDVRFSIRDADTVIYDEHTAGDAHSDPRPVFSQIIPMELYGRTWMIDMRSDIGFRLGNTQSKPTIILIAGLMIEGFIVALLILMARANRRAVAYADKVTADLRSEQRKLAMSNLELAEKNAELEQYAYVASHDLKTPIRGIGGLTEMIEEDLQEYFKSPAANPEVSENLRLIHDRVDRMHQLTQGILQLSLAGTATPDGGP
jgi:CHASE1-domain containing sensor protein